MSRRGRGRGGTSGAPRRTKVRVRGKGRTPSSRRWLQRQLSDPYVAEAQRRGYRSRAAFKLAQIDDKFRLLASGARVVDLGAAPGGWTQVALERTGGSGRVVAVDLLAMEPLAGTTLVEADVLAEATPARLRAALGGPADVVLSDMAAPATGHRQTDHLRVMVLAEAALDLAERLLVPGGAFVCKVLQGGGERTFVDRLKRGFERVRYYKPAASRGESREMYVVATGFRGPARAICVAASAASCMP